MDISSSTITEIRNEIERMEREIPIKRMQEGSANMIVYRNLKEALSKYSVQVNKEYIGIAQVEKYYCPQCGEVYADFWQAAACLKKCNKEKET